MNSVNMKLSADKALEIARQYAKLEPAELEYMTVLRQDGLYEIALRSAFMQYEVYVDAASGEVPGFFSEPVSPELAEICESVYPLAG